MDWAEPAVGSAKALAGTLVLVEGPSPGLACPALALGVLAFLLSALNLSLSLAVSALAFWGPRPEWGLGWGLRYDTSGVAFGITKCQCLVGSIC